MIILCISNSRLQNLFHITGNRRRENDNVATALFASMPRIIAATRFNFCGLIEGYATQLELRYPQPYVEKIVYPSYPTYRFDFLSAGDRNMYGLAPCRTWQPYPQISTQEHVSGHYKRKGQPYSGAKLLTGVTKS